MAVQKSQMYLKTLARRRPTAAGLFGGSGPQHVGELDPKTGVIAEDRPSDGAKIDPHTPVFDHNGILWFTNEETNYIGRLDPKTGKMILTKSPTPHAVPYGIVVTRGNVPFFCEFGTNPVGRRRFCGGLLIQINPHRKRVGPSFKFSTN